MGSLKQALSTLSIPAVVAGFAAPLTGTFLLSLYATDHPLGLSVHDVVTASYNQPDEQEAPEILPAAYRYEDLVKVDYPSGQIKTVKAAASAINTTDDRQWAFLGKIMSTEEAIEAMQDRAKASPNQEGLKNFFVQCFNDESAGVQGAIFNTFFTSDEDAISSNRYHPDVESAVGDPLKIPSLPNESDYQSCLGLKQLHDERYGKEV